MLTGRRRWSGGAKAAILAAALSAGLLAGCGGSSGDSTASQASPAQLQAAKKEGEEVAREHDRLDALQRQVHAIKRRIGRKHRRTRPRASAPEVVPTMPTAPAAAPGSVRSFHAPSGNVSCEVFIEGATCTVASVGETFVLEPGTAARVESASTLPSGAGELAEYGSTVSDGGSVSCEIPPSDVPRGVSCVDSSDGHGFEASRVSDRQLAY